MKKLVSRFQILIQPIQGYLLAEVKDESESRVAPNVVSILTNSPLINFPVQGDLLRRHNERFENLPEDIRVNKFGEDAGLMRKISRDQYFCDS